MIGGIGKALSFRTERDAGIRLARMRMAHAPSFAGQNDFNVWMSRMGRGPETKRPICGSAGACTSLMVAVEEKGRQNQALKDRARQGARGGRTAAGGSCMPAPHMVHAVYAADEWEMYGFLSH